MNSNLLQQCFVDFVKIQDIQIDMFNNLDSKNYPDLDTIIFERNRAFENLRSAISLASPSDLNRFKQDADMIINKDKIFMQTLEEQKDELLKKINRGAKGKQLLKGYNVGTSNSLRFMSNKI
ncbi:MAG: hypothetical protein HQK68_09100 [Desulfamplus sp.]|nr:hypothetical protein [Desulfamplus sp.]